jgi:hypothetical protein
MELNYEFSNSKAENELLTRSKANAYEKNYNQLVDSLSNHFNQNIYTNKAGIKVSFKNKKIKYSFGTAAGFTNFDLKDITLDKTYTRNFTNMFPTGNFQYTYKANHSLSVRYDGKTVQPTIGQLQQLRNNNNPLNEYIGNPFLKQSFRHNTSINHNSYNFINDLWSYQSININLTENAITNSILIADNGKRITQPVNTNGNISANGYMGMGKKIKKFDLYFGLGLQFNYAKFNEIINYKTNGNKNSNVSFSVNFSKSKTKLYEINLENNFGYNVNQSTAYNKTIRFNSNTTSLSTAYYIKKTWKISSDVEFIYRQKTSDFSDNLNNQIWNAQLEKSFHQDEFTLFFSIKDILNQNIGIDRNLSGNTFTEIRNDRLKRYWMIGFRWDFKNKNAAAK